MRELRQEEITKIHLMAAKKGLIKLNVSIYARKSTEDKTDTSIATQIENCREFVQKYDSLFTLSEEHIFQEDKVSGMYIENRKELSKLLNLVDKGIINVVVVARSDRFSRDSANMVMLLRKLEAKGVYFIAGDDLGDDSAAGILIKQIMYATSEFHVRNTAENVMKVHTKLVKDGKTVGGLGNYGYVISERKYIQEPIEAQAVSLVFDLFLAGSSYSEISEQLDIQGYKPRFAKKFSNSGIHDILNNKRNCGISIWNSLEKRKGGNRIIKQNFDEVISEDVVANPIISKDKFDRVQAILNTKVQAKINKSGPVYLLTGLLVCGDCGGAITGTSSKSSKKKSPTRSYMCKNHSKRYGNTCLTKNINVKWLDLVVKSQITKLIKQHFKTNPMPKAFLKEYLQDEKSKIKRLSRELSLEKESLSKLVIGFHKTDNELIKASTEIEIEKVSHLIDVSKSKKRDLEEKIKASKLKQIAINSGKIKVEEMFKNDLISRRIIQTFIKKIVISNDKIEIEYKEGEIQ